MECEHPILFSFFPLSLLDDFLCVCNEKRRKKEKEMGAGSSTPTFADSALETETEHAGSSASTIPPLPPSEPETYEEIERKIFLNKYKEMESIVESEDLDVGVEFESEDDPESGIKINFKLIQSIMILPPMKFNNEIKNQKKRYLQSLPEIKSVIEMLLDKKNGLCKELSLGQDYQPHGGEDIIKSFFQSINSQLEKGINSTEYLKMKKVMLKDSYFNNKDYSKFIPEFKLTFMDICYCLSENRKLEVFTSKDETMGYYENTLGSPYFESASLDCCVDYVLSDDKKLVPVFDPQYRLPLDPNSRLGTYYISSVFIRKESLDLSSLNHSFNTRECNYGYGESNERRDLDKSLKDKTMKLSNGSFKFSAAYSVVKAYYDSYKNTVDNKSGYSIRRFFGSNNSEIRKMESVFGIWSFKGKYQIIPVTDVLTPATDWILEGIVYERKTDKNLSYNEYSPLLEGKQNFWVFCLTVMGILMSIDEKIDDGGLIKVQEGFNLSRVGTKNNWPGLGASNPNGFDYNFVVQNYMNVVTKMANADSDSGEDTMYRLLILCKHLYYMTTKINENGPLQDYINKTYPEYKNLDDCIVSATTSLSLLKPGKSIPVIKLRKDDIFFMGGIVYSLDDSSVMIRVDNVKEFLNKLPDNSNKGLHMYRPIFLIYRAGEESQMDYLRYNRGDPDGDVISGRAFGNLDDEITHEEFTEAFQQLTSHALITDRFGELSTLVFMRQDHLLDPKNPNYFCY